MWPDVHDSLIYVARELLAPTVRPKYFVRIDLRVYVSDDEDPGRRVLVPDLKIAETAQGGEKSIQPRTATGAGIAEPIIITKLIDEEIHEAYLEIIDRESRQVVTFIEVISPSNKVSGSQGLAQLSAETASGARLAESLDGNRSAAHRRPVNRASSFPRRLLRACISGWKEARRRGVAYSTSGLFAESSGAPQA